VLEVVQRLRGYGTSLGQTSTAGTGEDGSWSVTVPRGPSRVIWVAYRYSSEDREFTSTNDLEQRVRAALTLHATRHLRNGQSIKFRGQLLGGFLPRNGKIIELQVKVGRKWQDFRAVRTKSNGSFRASRRLMQTFGPTRYAFRAIARGENGYPFELGTSPTRNVAVN
jgi:hypothetical protein